MQKTSNQLLVVAAILSLGTIISTMPASAAISKPSVEKPGAGNTLGDNGTSNQKTDVEVSLEKSEGRIKLTEAPKIGFKSIKMNAGTMRLTADSIAGKLRILNPGLEDGYMVSASVAKFIDKKSIGVSEAPERLKGAAITIQAGQVAAEDAANQSKVPTASDTVTLNRNNTPMLMAKKGEGLGIFKVTYNNISLDIPDGSKPGTYTTAITWTLSDTPKAE